MQDKLSELIQYLKSRNVDYADCRFERKESESTSVTDSKVDSAFRQINMGVGIRVIANGAWGFAASSSLRPTELIKTANRAINIAKASAITKKGSLRFAHQEVFKDYYKSPCKIDPFTVSSDEKINQMVKICDILKDSPKVKSSEASMTF